MASKSLFAPWIRQVTKRGYAQAAPVIKKDVKLTSSRLPNQTFVAALDNGSPVTRVTVAFKAGARFEPVGEPGIAHALRSAAGLSTGHASNFILARKLAQIGASVTASGDREFIYYTLETTQDNLPIALECLSNLVSCQEFRPWELSDNEPRLKFDIAGLPPQVRAVDLLHKAAFRRGLGNSLFISPKRIGKISSESLQHYVSSTMSASRMAVAVVGDTEDKATWIASHLKLDGRDSSQDTPTSYYGGDQRKEMGGDLAHVALAVCGAPAGTPQALALTIAAKAFGNGPVTKWGCDNSQLARAIGNIGPFAAAGFNVSYSDSGLFGVVLSVPKDEATTAVKAVANLLRNKSLDAKSIKAGKNQLKLQILSEADEGTSLAELLAAQGFYTGTARTPTDIAAAIDAVTESDVMNALSSALKSRLSIGAAGNLGFVPYSDEI